MFNIKEWFSGNRKKKAETKNARTRKNDVSSNISDLNYLFINTADNNCSDRNRNYHDYDSDSNHSSSSESSSSSSSSSSYSGYSSSSSDSGSSSSDSGGGGGE